MSLITIGVAFLWLLLWICVGRTVMAKHGNLWFLLAGIGTCALIVLGILSLPASIPQGNIALAIYVGTGFAIFMASYFAVYYAWWNRRKSKLPSSPPNLDPRFHHLTVWLFYPKKKSWFNKQRNPIVENPRQKLVTYPKMNTAYYMRDDIWNLALQNKIQWYSDDEQDDLEAWCHTKSYTLFPHSPTDKDLGLETAKPVARGQVAIKLEGTEDTEVKDVSVPSGMTAVEDIAGRRNKIEDVTVRDKTEGPEQGSSSKTEENGR